MARTKTRHMKTILRSALRRRTLTRLPWMSRIAPLLGVSRVRGMLRHAASEGGRGCAASRTSNSCCHCSPRSVNVSGGVADERGNDPEGKIRRAKEPDARCRRKACWMQSAALWSRSLHMPKPQLSGAGQYRKDSSVLRSMSTSDTAGGSADTRDCRVNIARLNRKLGTGVSSPSSAPSPRGVKLRAAESPAPVATSLATAAVAMASAPVATSPSAPVATSLATSLATAPISLATAPISPPPGVRKAGGPFRGTPCTPPCLLKPESGECCDGVDPLWSAVSSSPSWDARGRPFAPVSPRSASPPDSTPAR